MCYCFGQCKSEILALVCVFTVTTLHSSVLMSNCEVSHCITAFAFCFVIFDFFDFSVIKNKDIAGWRWCMTIISAPRRQRHTDV